MLIGLAAAGIVHVLTGAGALVAREVSGIPPRVLSEWRTLLGGTHILTVYLSGVTWGVAISLVLLSMLFALRRLLRREWAAIVAGALVLSVGATLEAGTPLAIIPLLALNLLSFVVLSRVGLISVITISFGLVVLEAFPLTIPPSGWTARLGLIGVLSLGALAIVCVRVVTTADALRPHAPATLRQLRT